MRLEITFGVAFDRHGQPVQDADAKINQVIAYAADLFGGVTIIRTVGGWLNDKRALVCESGRLLIIDGYQMFADKDGKERLPQYIGKLFNQSAVMARITDNEAKSIDIDYGPPD